MINRLPVFLFSILFFLIALPALAAEQIAISGFKPFSEKTEYISTAYNDYLNQNLTAAGYLISSGSNEKLETLLAKSGSLFLASREFAMSDSLLSFTISGEYKFSGKNVLLYIELYSADKNRMLLKKEFNGKKNDLLTFCDVVTRNILSVMGSSYRPRNIFPISENKIVADYLKALKYQKAADFERMADLLDLLEPYHGKYPILNDLYEYATARIDSNNLGAFSKPLHNATVIEAAEDTEVEAYLRKIIAKGYRFVYQTASIKKLEDDSTRANIVSSFELLFKKVYRKKLLQESKKRKADTRFNNMGRYYFSGNAEDNEQFVEFLLKQKMKLTFFDVEGKELFFSDDIVVKQMTYDGGGYRYTKSPPFPIMPKGPASNGAYSMTSRIDVVFMIEEVDTETIDKIAYSEVKVFFEE